jgi:hypothetical protein
MGMAYAGTVTRAPLQVVPAAPAAAVWHVANAGRVSGPFTVEQVRDAVASGQLTAATTVWTAGMEAWAPMASVPALAALFMPPPPPPTP